MSTPMLYAQVDEAFQIQDFRFQHGEVNLGHNRDGFFAGGGFGQVQRLVETVIVKFLRSAVADFSSRSFIVSSVPTMAWRVGLQLEQLLAAGGAFPDGTSLDLDDVAEEIDQNRGEGRPSFPEAGSIGPDRGGQGILPPQSPCHRQES
jgi:hypothetical protein